MNAKVIAICNQKGGVGKTTTVWNVGAELARRGHATLLVDLDPQSSLTLTLGVDAEERNMADVLGITERGSGDVRTIVRTAGERLDLAPSDIMLSRTELGLVARPAREYQLQRALEPASQQYGFILLDAPPSLGLLTINALLASQYVIVPTQLDMLALRGLGLFMQTMQEVAEDYGRSAELLGVVATMVDLRPVHSRDVWEVIQQRDDLCAFKTAIPRTIRFSEALVTRQVLADYEPNHAGAVAYAELTEEILNRVA